MSLRRSSVRRVPRSLHRLDLTKRWGHITTDGCRARVVSARLTDCVPKGHCFALPAHPNRPGLAELCCLDVCVRICVIGNSGSGKSTLARVLARELGLAHIELDSFFHQPDWQATPPDLFRRKVSAAQEAAENTTGGWVCDGNYMRHLTDLTVERADVIVCFQFSRVRVMRQLIRRTLRRSLLREELWNGNRERFRNMFSPKPEVNILRWAWTQHDNYTAKFAELRSHSTATWIDIRTAHDRDSAIDAVKAALA